MSSAKLRIGTRASALARWQANWVAARLAERGAITELVPITTRGDLSQGDRIGNIGSPGAFTKELQRALLDGTIDLTVHSLKDLPTDKVEGLQLSAVPERETPHDVLVSREQWTLEALPRSATIGTESLRRRAQLLHARADLQMRDIRGNVDTRLKKLAAGEYDAIVLAAAGLKRLGLESQITEVLDASIVLPAVGQGALGIETRADDPATAAIVAQLDHPATHRAVVAERALLAALLGGCLAPVGAWARQESDGRLRLDAVVLSADGVQRLTASRTSSDSEPTALGEGLASELLARGAGDLIARARKPS